VCFINDDVEDNNNNNNNNNILLKYGFSYVVAVIISLLNHTGYVLWQIVLIRLLVEF
jgi:hypothetical protein